MAYFITIFINFFLNQITYIRRLKENLYILIRRELTQHFFYLMSWYMQFWLKEIWKNLKTDLICSVFIHLAIKPKILSQEKKITFGKNYVSSSPLSISYNLMELFAFFLFIERMSKQKGHKFMSIWKLNLKLIPKPFKLHNQLQALHAKSKVKVKSKIER